MARFALLKVLGEVLVAIGGSELNLESKVDSNNQKYDTSFASYAFYVFLGDFTSACALVA